MGCTGQFFFEDSIHRADVMVMGTQTVRLHAAVDCRGRDSIICANMEQYLFTPSFEHSQPQNHAFTTNGQQGQKAASICQKRPRCAHPVCAPVCSVCAECARHRDTRRAQRPDWLPRLLLHAIADSRPHDPKAHLWYANANVSRKWLTTVPRAKPRRLVVVVRFTSQRFKAATDLHCYI